MGVGHVPDVQGSFNPGTSILLPALIASLLAPNGDTVAGFSCNRLSYKCNTFTSSCAVLLSQKLSLGPEKFTQHALLAQMIFFCLSFLSCNDDDQDITGTYAYLFTGDIRN